MSKNGTQTTPPFCLWDAPMPLTRSPNESLFSEELMQVMDESSELIPGPPPLIRQSVHDDPEDSDEVSMGPLPLVRTSCVSHTCMCHSNDATLNDFLSMESLSLGSISCVAQHLQGDSVAETLYDFLVMDLCRSSVSHA
jgi:hypothetical protein